MDSSDIMSARHAQRKRRLLILAGALLGLVVVTAIAAAMGCTIEAPRNMAVGMDTMYRHASLVGGGSSSTPIASIFHLGPLDLIVPLRR